MAVVEFINRDLIRRRRSELGLSARMLAKDLGVTGASYVAIENGRAQSDLSLGVVVRLARLLALTLDEIMGTEAPEPSATTAGDAELLGSLLKAVDQMVPTRTICETTGWSLERYEHAEAELERCLGAAGMTLHRLQGRVSIIRQATSAHDDLLAAEEQDRRFSTMSEALDHLGEPCRSLLEGFYLLEKSDHFRTVLVYEERRADDAIVVLGRDRAAEREHERIHFLGNVKDHLV